MKLPFGITITRDSARNELIPAEPAPSEMSLGQVTPDYWRRVFGNDGQSSERIAAVFACVYVIASTTAALPLQLFRKTDGSREREKKHRLAGFLDDAPNGAMTWTQMREAMLYQLVLRGNAYTRNFWQSGNLTEVFPLPLRCITPKLTDARRIGYELGENGVKIPTGTFFAPDLSHFKGISADGLEGISPIEHCRLTMRSALAFADHGATTAEKGAPLRGVITNAPTLQNADRAKEMRQRWSQAFSEAAAGEGVAILENDLKFQAVSMSMRDAQFIENCRFSVEEIARIFNVPPHKIQMLERATFNNIEHLSREFYTAALLPWITRIEATLNHTFLTAGDRAAGLYLRHNVDGLLRGDMATRSDSYTKQISSGVLTPNEARALEDRGPVEGGDLAFFPINHQPLSSAATPPPPPTV